MSVLKTAFTSLFIGFYFSASSQNLSSLFAKSYAAEKNANYTEAIAALQPQTNANSYEVNLRLGWLYYADKKHNESIGYYQKAIALKPNSTEAIWGLINPLSVQEKWVKVEYAYKEILRLDPTNTKANYYLGSIYFYRKDYTNAKKYLSMVVTLFPFDHDANLLLAWSLYYLGDQKGAKNVFYRVLNNKPDDASAKEGLALIK